MKKQFCCIPALLLWVALSLGAWLLPDQAQSDSERRPLAQMPQISGKNILSGRFMDGFEDYALDQFPLRDAFRSLKTRFHTGLLGQQDSNGIYLYAGHAAKMEYPLDRTSVKYALGRFNHLYETCLTGSRVFMAVVPDKNYYLAPESGRLSLDYDSLMAQVRDGMPWAEQITLTDVLSLEDYYYTDTHWRQENLLPAADVLCRALGVQSPRPEDFTPVTLEEPFRGVYMGQSALPLEPDRITLLESDVLSQCRVYDHETGKTFQVYDRTKLQSRDLYDVFLGGAKALLTVENHCAGNDRELIVFRDSFGSSMIPLLLRDYSRVTVVDIRYVSIDLLKNFVDFRGQDVLMLYSTLILNGSSAIK